jgi:hydrogenase-4 component F
MTRLVFAIVDGRPRAAARKSTERFPELPGVIMPPLLFLAFSLWLGLATPSLLREAWTPPQDTLFPTP